MIDTTGKHVAVCPGTFDPITNGHVDVIGRAAGLFGHVIVAVSGDSGKTPMFTKNERMELVRAACAHLPNVEVDFFEGLVVNYAKSRGAHALVKGLRVISDFEREMQMEHMNRALAEDIPTVFLNALVEHAFLSSSLVKEVCALGADVSDFVSPAVEAALRAKLGPPTP